MPIYHLMSREHKLSDKVIYSVYPLVAYWTMTNHIQVVPCEVPLWHCLECPVDLFAFQIYSLTTTESTAENTPKAFAVAPHLKLYSRHHMWWAVFWLVPAYCNACWGNFQPGAVVKAFRVFLAALSRATSKQFSELICCLVLTYRFQGMYLLLRNAYL